MDKVDIEFWNGILKGVILAEEKVKEKLAHSPDGEKETVQMILRGISDLEDEIKNVHTSGIRKAIERLKSS